MLEFLQEQAFINAAEHLAFVTNYRTLFVLLLFIRIFYESKFAAALLISLRRVTYFTGGTSFTEKNNLEKARELEQDAVMI